MAENDPAAPVPVGARTGGLALWLVRLLWPLPGAIAGAGVGFQLYFRQPGLNTDTFAPFILASFWAFGGMLSGMLVTGIAAWLIQRGVRRLFSTGPLITACLTLLCLIGLCLVSYAPLESRLSALFWPKQRKEAPRPLAAPAPSPCTQAPPSDLNARKSWELECR